MNYQTKLTAATELVLAYEPLIFFKTDAFIEYCERHAIRPVAAIYALDHHLGAKEYALLRNLSYAYNAALDSYQNAYGIKKSEHLAKAYIRDKLADVYGNPEYAKLFDSCITDILE